MNDNASYAMTEDRRTNREPIDTHLHTHFNVVDVLRLQSVCCVRRNEEIENYNDTRESM